jgi:hypothetical protein
MGLKLLIGVVSAVAMMVTGPLYDFFHSGRGDRNHGDDARRNGKLEDQTTAALKV